MRDLEFLSTLLRVETPWQVSGAALDVKLKRVDVTINGADQGDARSAIVMLRSMTIANASGAISICAAINSLSMPLFRASTVRTTASTR